MLRQLAGVPVSGPDSSLEEIGGPESFLAVGSGPDSSLDEIGGPESLLAVVSGPESSLAEETGSKNHPSVSGSAARSGDVRCTSH